jgi:hypothetical protein
MLGISPEEVLDRAECALLGLSEDTANAFPRAASWRQLGPFRELRRLWETRKGIHAVPAQLDFTFADLRPWINNIAVMKASPDRRDLYVRVLGRNIIGADKTDCTGYWLSAVVPQHAQPAVISLYRRCLREQAPQYEIKTLSDAGQPRTFHRLALPCRSADGEVETVMAAICLLPAGPLIDATLFEAVARKESEPG